MTEEYTLLSLQSYLYDPCGTASVPYWKQKGLTIPESMKIVHERDYINEMFLDYNDEPYFRLYHNLKDVKQEITREVEVVSGVHNIGEFAQLINASYSDLSVTIEQLESYRRTPVYCSDLWILLKEKVSGIVLAGGIADYDREVKELILEWIQVLPSYRRHGYGQIIVNCLLSKMQGIANFATVSGKINNPANPEILYRKCGFTGDDIWHILTLKQSA
ncbi:MAG: GNAT family N-acetyltransferase [bacterium]|nr:GNAT family N-acetyltransferase [Clostridium sp.]MCM1538985.1 GNAT family N-acetyltransferase [bacterium]